MTSILLSLSENGYCLMCDICFAVIFQNTVVVVLCVTSVLLSLSDTVFVVLCATTVLLSLSDTVFIVLCVTSVLLCRRTGSSSWPHLC